jgi:DNA repair protein RecN (Recombination protein N)
VDEGQLIISRKIMEGHSVNKINGNTVNLSLLKEISSLLIDIHGQHDHQSLLNKSKHLEFLDSFIGEDIYVINEKYLEFFHKYNQLKKEYEKFQMNEEQRLREVSLLEYEINEIEEVNIRENEEEELESIFKKISGHKKIMEILDIVYKGLEETDYGKLSKEVLSVLEYDSSLENIFSSLRDMEAVSSEICREVYSYMNDFTYNENELEDVTERLDRIRRLMGKYGNSVEKINNYKKESMEKLQTLNHYEESKINMEKEIKITEQHLTDIGEEMSKIRQDFASAFSEKIRLELLDMNFLSADFKVLFNRKDKFSITGVDEAEFLISTNPGEPLKSLSKVASEENFQG